MLDVDCEASVLYQRAGLDLDDVPAASLLARRLGAQVRRVDGVLVRRGDACKVMLHGVVVLCVRRHLTAEALRFAICHELAELRLAELDYREVDVEDVADALGAALACPRDAFRGAVREHGREAYAQLALDFTTSQTCAALRVGEVLDEPLAVVAPRRVRVRGGAYEWPDERELRRCARVATPGLRRAELTDDRRRVVLLVNVA